MYDILRSGYFNTESSSAVRYSSKVYNKMADYVIISEFDNIIGAKVVYEYPYGIQE